MHIKPIVLDRDVDDSQLEALDESGLFVQAQDGFGEHYFEEAMHKEAYMILLSHDLNCHHEMQIPSCFHCQSTSSQRGIGLALLCK